MAKAKDPSAWLQKACTRDKDTPRGEFLTPQGNMASDSYRMHVANDLPPAPAGTLPRGWVDVLEEFRRMPLTTRVSALALAQAARAALALGAEDRRRKYAPVTVLRLAMNGRLVCSAKHPDTGEVCATFGDGDEWRGAWHTTKGRTWQDVEVIQYFHEGPDQEVGVNPKFLLDALAGMAPVVSAAADKYRLYLSDGIHEACIMAMHTG